MSSGGRIGSAGAIVPPCSWAINNEPAALRDRYGRHTFGQSALLARRLVEAGATFVTVNCVPWDHHGTPPQLRTEVGARLLIQHLDRAIAALVEDLCQRGLYERVLVVAMGEFGRTPRMNADAGRDYWGHVQRAVSFPDHQGRGLNLIEHGQPIREPVG